MGHHALDAAWPLRLLMEQIFSKADAIELPDYKSVEAVPSGAE